MYHVTGVLRTKPGRGDPTISMSCSDKIAKWIFLGLQGSLLSFLLKEPIYLKAIVIGKCPFSEESIQRALINRSIQLTSSEKYKLMTPIIGQSNLLFRDSKLAKKLTSTDDDDDQELKACPNSVCWTHGVKTKPLFVLVKGFLQGASLKNKKLSNYPPISKYLFYSNFQNVLSKLEKKELVDGKAYNEVKNLDLDYNKSKSEFFRVYSGWIRTDQQKYYKFSIK